jgi:succinylarginine dihydrolase
MRTQNFNTVIKNGVFQVDIILVSERVMTCKKKWKDDVREMRENIWQRVTEIPKIR